MITTVDEPVISGACILRTNIGIIEGWGTGSKEIIPLDTSEGGETKSEYNISPILWLYVVVLIIDHISWNILLLIASLRPRPWIAYSNIECYLSHIHVAAELLHFGGGSKLTC